MAQTQFFQRSDKNIDSYKKEFTKTLQKVRTVKLFSDEVISFFDKWIDVQVKYIPRDDIDNFWTHLDKIFKEKDFYDFMLEELKTVKNNWKIQEYSFNLISKLDDSAKDFIDFQKKKKAWEELEKNKNASKKEDEEEMQKILEGL